MLPRPAARFKIQKVICGTWVPLFALGFDFPHAPPVFLHMKRGTTRMLPLCIEQPLVPRACSHLRRPFGEVGSNDAEPKHSATP